MPDADLTVVRHADERRFELLLDGEHAGELIYRFRADSVVAFLHTEVEPSLGRRGLGSFLVAAALDDARERRQQVVLFCPFVAAFIRRRPEYADLVVADPARRE